MKKQLARAAMVFLLLSCRDKAPAKPYGPRAEPPMGTQLANPESKAPAPRKQAPKKDDGCPPEMARVDDFCIDRWEIHLVDMHDGIRHPMNKVPPRSMDGLMAESAPNIYPQGHLSQISAGNACRNAKKRLCTRDEWVAACKGPDNTKFPYGNEMQEGACNVNKRDPHILDRMFPDIPHMQRTGRHFNDERLLLQPGYLAETGEHEGCVNGYGIYDMDGNLSEWIKGKRMNAGIMRGTFAGNPFSSKGIAGCFRLTKGHAEGYLDYSIGTRCCASTSRGSSRSPRE